MKLMHITWAAFWLVLFLTACSTKPATVTSQFLEALQNKDYNHAAHLALPGVQAQVAIIRQDKDALFNGQGWNYNLLTDTVKGDSANVTYINQLQDGSRVWQLAKLYRSADGWKVASIRNTKINYSRKALKTRTYPDYGNQMLIAPLDINEIDEQALPAHKGRFIIVSGNLCKLEENDSLTLMQMGADSSIPLLDVTVTGAARDSAKAARENLKR